ncbi:MAG: GAF domain-containing sensor histidine kinase, partial [Chloroflexota bacterium]
DFRVRRNNAGYTITEEDTQVSHTIILGVIESGDAYITSDALSDVSLADADSVYMYRMASVMCVPLIARGQIIGSIYMENRSRVSVFDDEDLRAVRYFASQAAVSIENAMLNEDLEARVDRRTQELETALSQLETRWLQNVEYNRIQTKLTANIAHDLRSPLSTVITALELIDDEFYGDVTEDQHKWLRTSIKSVQYVMTLVGDFFDIIKLKSNQLKLHPEPTNAQSFLADVCQVGEALPWQNGVGFRCQIGDDLPQVNIDATRIQQVIVNLLSNALKFTAMGEVVLYARSYRHGEMLLIGVKDTGTGIPEEDLPHIFDRFRQSGESKSKQAGTGLGLAISQELIELHGGQIAVKSVVGEGTDFYFAIPAVA